MTAPSSTFIPPNELASYYDILRASVPPANPSFITPGYTVASLPAPSASLAGARAYVTDAAAPSFLGSLTGGGAVVCPVFCNGTAWVAG